MIVLSLVFLAVYAINVIQTGFPPWLVTTARSVNGLIWFVFGADLAIRVLLAERRVGWILRHPIDVLSVVVPPLRPLRLLTAFSAGQSLLARQGGFRHTGMAVVSSAGMLILIGALVELSFEQEAPGALITNFGDAVWWAITTTTTVGYGDLYPVTWEGRVVAGMLMVVGIAVLGAVTATVAAWFIEMAESGHRADDDAGGDLPAAATTAERDLDDSPAALLDTDKLSLLGALHRAGVLTDEEVATAVARLDKP
jgi:voltage-gated potassium channel